MELPLFRHYGRQGGKFSIRYAIHIMFWNKLHSIYYDICMHGKEVEENVKQENLVIQMKYARLLTAITIQTYKSDLIIVIDQQPSSSTLTSFFV